MAEPACLLSLFVCIVEDVLRGDQGSDVSVELAGSACSLSSICSVRSDCSVLSVISDDVT